jgi:transposase InsO family protein
LTWPKTILFGQAGADSRKWAKNGCPENRNRQGFLATPPNEPKLSVLAWVFTPAFLRRISRPFPCRFVPCGNTPGGGWTIALQVKEIGSGASQRERREQLLEAARRREIDVVLVWRLDRWGRSVTDLLATLQELEHLGVGFVSLTEALDLTTPAGRAMAALLAVLPSSKGRFSGNESVPAWPMPARTANAGPAVNGGPPRRPGPKALPCRHQ